MTYRDRWIERARERADVAGWKVMNGTQHERLWAHWEIILIKAAARKMRERRAECKVLATGRTEIDSDGTVRKYDAAGRLREERARNRITGYDSEGKVIFCFGVF